MILVKWLSGRKRLPAKKLYGLKPVSRVRIPASPPLVRVMEDLRNLEENGIDENIAISLRPQQIDEFIGQSKLLDNLKIFISSAKKRNAQMDHCLFYGPPGLGKTTLANIIAKEMGVNIRTTSGPMLMKTGDLATILTNLQKGDVLFIDEIHRMPIAVEEVLYSAMEDNRLDIIIGTGPTAKTIKIDLNPFTLIGDTTRLGLLTNPLKDRFGITMQLEFYSSNDLAKIAGRYAERHDIKITEGAKLRIGERSRGTPRIAIRLIKRVIDIATYLEKDEIDEKLANDALDKLGIDSLGLDGIDKKYLEFINKNYKGGPVGIETISAGLSEDSGTLEEVVEPFLIQSGLLERTPRGRVLTFKCLQHLRK